jgi:hypothetical protein
LPILNCQRHRVRWMDGWMDADDDDDLASRPASNHSVFESAAECWTAGAPSIPEPASLPTHWRLQARRPPKVI